MGPSMPGIPGRYVYVACSAGNDHFAEITAVSMATMRMVSPGARITVLSDRETSLLDTPGVAAIRSAANDFRIIDCPGANSVIRSRYLKCNMRQLLEGGLVYLDSDTIIMRSPDGIWDTDADVAASPNLAPDGKSYLASSAVPAEWAALGWTFAPRLYLNAGVFFIADNKAARAFAEQYRSSWLQFQRVLGQPNEQPAFNHAVSAAGARVAVLPASYNAQISMNVMALRGAKIVHYFTGRFEGSLDTIAHTAAKRLKSEGVLDIAAIQAAITSGNPWIRTDSYRKAIASKRYWKLGTVAFRRLAGKAGLLH